METNLYSISFYFVYTAYIIVSCEHLLSILWPVYSIHNFKYPVANI